VDAGPEGAVAVDDLEVFGDLDDEGDVDEAAVEGDARILSVGSEWEAWTGEVVQ
jgi:hypothetical protein